MRHSCPRCEEPAIGAEEKRYRTGLTGSNISKANANLTRPNFYDTDSEGNAWYMCPVCGLLWVPATGRRNRDLGISEDDYLTTKSGRKRGAD